MKRYTATVRIELEAETIEARDHLIDQVAVSMNRKPPGICLPDIGEAQVIKTRVSRVRPARSRRK